MIDKGAVKEHHDNLPPPLAEHPNKGILRSVALCCFMLLYVALCNGFLQP